MEEVIFRAKHIFKKYGFNKHYTLKDCNLEVKGGSIFGFLGPNGAGKSTFIKSCIGLSNFEKGEVTLCGKDNKKDYVDFKYLLGFVPDQYVLYEKSTGFDYLVELGKIYNIKKDELKEKITTLAKRLSIEKAITRKISTYSHGMKQKIAIIASLLHEPKLWILDEPLTGLDPISVLQVKEMMKEYAAKGNIVFFSSHLIDIVKNLCTDIAIISNGQIRVVSSLKDISENHDSLENYYLSVINSK